MTIKSIHFNSWESVSEHIKSHAPSLYVSSQTSTVIPYEFLNEYYSNTSINICSLSNLPKKIELVADHLIISGPVTWQEALEFVNAKGRDLLSFPTETLACVTAGVATSATGERSFSNGSLREQIKELKYIDYEGREICLNQSEFTFADSQLLEKYQLSYAKYNSFKNAPFPRVSKAIDLFVGTEGQLGVIKEVTLKTIELNIHKYFLLKLPSWRVVYQTHLEIFNKVQKFRGSIRSVEFVDGESCGENFDQIFLEIAVEEFEILYQHFFEKLSLNEDQIFEISEANYHLIREKVPRHVADFLSKNSSKKMGTDAQVSPENFKSLLDVYRELAQHGIDNILFGHFGDAHLHFNFLANKTQEDFCQSLLSQFYLKVKELDGSPFAEHGIGLIKQRYVKAFLSDVQLDMFKKLKTTHDPHNQFFPKGFMDIGKEN